MSVIELDAYRPEALAAGRNRQIALQAIVGRLMALRRFSSPCIAGRMVGDGLVRNGLLIEFRDDRGHTYMSVTPKNGSRRVFTAWLEGPGKIHVMSWRRGWEKDLF